jgi:hypothetical protein
VEVIANLVTVPSLLHADIHRCRAAGQDSAGALTPKPLTDPDCLIRFYLDKKNPYMRISHPMFWYRIAASELATKGLYDSQTDGHEQ